MPDKTPGQHAFEAYWTAYGHGIPSWEHTAQRVKALWEAAADAVIMRVDI
jgi:hypothetical protein